MSFNALVAEGPRLPVAAVANKEGAFVSPYAAVFPFNQDEMPASIFSPDWNKLDLNTSGETAMPLTGSEPFCTLLEIATLYIDQ